MIKFILNQHGGDTMKEEQFEILVGLINETNAKVDDIKENLNITNAKIKAQ